MRSGKKGFTLIELMIVVAIIGVLASVALVNFGNMLEKAREGATKGNIGAIKAAIGIYYGDYMGAWPGDIEQSNIYFTKYLDVVPPVEIRHVGSGAALSGRCAAVTVVMIATDIGTDSTFDGWRYNKASGYIWVNNSQTDLSGVVYSFYGYE